MEQIFDFQFSNVRPSTVEANKGGEVTHFVIQIRYNNNNNNNNNNKHLYSAQTKTVLGALQ